MNCDQTESALEINSINRFLLELLQFLINCAYNIHTQHNYTKCKRVIAARLRYRFDLLRIERSSLYSDYKRSPSKQQTMCIFSSCLDSNVERDMHESTTNLYCVGRYCKSTYRETQAIKDNKKVNKDKLNSTIVVCNSCCCSPLLEYLHNHMLTNKL